MPRRRADGYVSLLHMCGRAAAPPVASYRWISREPKRMAEDIPQRDQVIPGGGL
jgi:hypothetical protein